MISRTSAATAATTTSAAAKRKAIDLKVPDLDEDSAERKRVLNVLAQRRYRERKRAHLRRLEEQVVGRSGSTEEEGEQQHQQHSSGTTLPRAASPAGSSTASEIATRQCERRSPETFRGDDATADTFTPGEWNAVPLPLELGQTGSWETVSSPGTTSMPIPAEMPVPVPIPLLVPMPISPSPSMPVPDSTEFVDPFLFQSIEPSSWTPYLDMQIPAFGDLSTMLPSLPTTPSPSTSTSPSSGSRAISGSSSNSSPSYPTDGTTSSSPPEEKSAAAHFSSALQSHQTHQTSPWTFPDETNFPLTEVKLLRACMAIARRLNLEDLVFGVDSSSPFTNPALHGLSFEHLPPNLQPTRTQLTIPHHPIFDLLPWPSTRNKLILIFSQPPEMRPPQAASPTAMLDLVYDIEDSAEGVRIWGEDPYSDHNWEVGEKVFRSWWWAFDSEIIRRSNRWRRGRGASLLTMGKVIGEVA